MVVLSRYRFKTSNFIPRPSTLLAWADVRVGFPSALMRVVALMAFLSSIHNFLCNCGDRMERLDRHLTSERCNTLSMAKTLGKACVLSIRIQSHIVFIYIVRTFNVTPSNLYVVEATHSERCTLEDLYSYFYYYYYIIIAIILILITIIIITIVIVVITIIIITILLLLVVE